MSKIPRLFHDISAEYCAQVEDMCGAVNTIIKENGGTNAASVIEFAYTALAGSIGDIIEDPDIDMGKSDAIWLVRKMCKQLEDYFNTLDERRRNDKT